MRNFEELKTIAVDVFHGRIFIDSEDYIRDWDKLLEANDNPDVHHLCGTRLTEEERKRVNDLFEKYGDLYHRFIENFSGEVK